MKSKKPYIFKLSFLLTLCFTLNSCATAFKFSDNFTSHDYVSSYKGWSDEKISQINLLVDTYRIDESRKTVIFNLKKQEIMNVTTPVYKEYNVDVNPFLKFLIFTSEFFIGYFGTYQLTKDNNGNLPLQIGVGGVLAGTDLLLSLIPKTTSIYSRSINETKTGYETTFNSSYVNLNNKTYYTSAGEVRIPFSVIKNIYNLHFEKDGYVSDYYKMDKIRSVIANLEKSNNNYSYRPQIPITPTQPKNVQHHLSALKPGICGSLLNWVNTTRAIVFSIKESKRRSGKSFKAYLEGKEVSSGYTDYVIMYSQNAGNITIETQMIENGVVVPHKIDDFGRMQINLADYFCYKGEEELKKKGIGILINKASGLMVNQKQAKIITKIAETLYDYGTSNSNSEYVTNQISGLFFEFIKSKIFLNLDENVVEGINFSKDVAIDYARLEKYFGENPESAIYNYCPNAKECDYVIKIK